MTALRDIMGWGRISKTAQFRFNIENDEERTINTDWFSREIIHGVVTSDVWALMPHTIREGLNRAILKFDPAQEEDATRLAAGAMNWAGLSHSQADALVAAWRRRPKPDAKRLSMSRRAVRNLLEVMDRPEPWPNPRSQTGYRWVTQIEARMLIAEAPDFMDVTTGEPLDDTTRRRYATGAKGATASDRYYIRQEKHWLKDAQGRSICDENGEPLAEPPPAPLVSNPVVRKAIHEVRRHLVEYLMVFRQRPDEVYIELAREARMGKVNADRLLFRNRLRNRIRNEIVHEFGLDAQTSTQQRAALSRVVLCVQQGGVCPLCGKAGLTPRQASVGDDCEVAHIIPRGSGGHNGLANIVLAHTKCNRDMGRRTPREFWASTLTNGLDEGLVWIEGIYRDIERPRYSELRSTTGVALWLCYFTKRDDVTKIEQFKKDIKDIQEMTFRQEAATKYATRQMMSYIADALYGGKGLPERSVGSMSVDNARRIFATDGIWTSRLRREWGLFFDPHSKRTHGIGSNEEHARKEKDRGDHRHHAIDAVVIALCTRQVQIAWEEREKTADRDGVNTADEQALDQYRRLCPLDLPRPFKSREELREVIRTTVFGNNESERPVCHRPVKRKLIGALHEETLFGPVLDRTGKLTGTFTARKSVLALKPDHLRMPRPETEEEAIKRLANRRMSEKGVNERTARKWARDVVSSAGFCPALVDPPPEKSGIIRDRALRARLRECLEQAKLDPDNFTPNQLKKILEDNRNQGHERKWPLCHKSGVPIRSVILLRTMSNPVVVARKRPDYTTGHMVKDETCSSLRAYVGGNNHHIEIRVSATGKWSGAVVSAFEASQRNVARLQALRDAGIPKSCELRNLSVTDRRKFRSQIRAIELSHPLVDRRYDDAMGGQFVMSLCEGEMLFMKHKQTGEVGYFVVAKLDRSASGSDRIVLVPHWDARAATERKDAEGRKVTDSKRNQFAVTPADLQSLAPPDHNHAVKVRVTPLGNVQILNRD
ncbi:MAG: HNH endonuclease [Phycisphaerales bacterium]|nr:HNH endonuclease [Phycisphaerales bacterium]